MVNVLPSGGVYSQCDSGQCQIQTMLMLCVECDMGFCYECMADWRDHSKEYDVFLEELFEDNDAFQCIYCFITDMVDVDYINR